VTHQSDAEVIREGFAVSAELGTGIDSEPLEGVEQHHSLMESENNLRVGVSIAADHESFARLAGDRRRKRFRHTIATATTVVGGLASR
jgi:hypothetical protein